MGYGWMNLGSLALGLAAWVAPVAGIFVPAALRRRHAGTVCFCSFSACAIALFLQICYQRYLTEISDWSAILDTIDPLVSVCGILIAGTMAANAALLWRAARCEK